MDSEQTIPLTTHPSRGVLFAGVTWFLVYLATRFALEEMGLAPPWGLVVACAPLFAFYWFVWVVQRAVKSADELQRRIHLEALALAFPTTMLVLMTLGLLESLPAGRLEIPLRDLWAFLPPLYGICVLVANQRYR